MSTQRPMPAELANLKPPTRQDAAQRIRDRTPMGSQTIERFEGSLRGRQCANRMYSEDQCREWGREFDARRAEAIDDALATLRIEYKALLDRKAQIDAANAEALEAEVAELRSRYLSAVGATADGFEKALPDLLEERRRRATLDGMTETEKMREQMRSTIRL